MDSLFESSDPAWTAATPFLFGFSMVRGKGIRFFSNNLEARASLRNLVLNICGYDHVIHAPSLVGQFYWIQLHRVPSTVDSVTVFDYFQDHGCSPVLVFPTHSVGSLQSNSLKVIFNSKRVPEFLWSQQATDEPLREISFLADQPPTFVVHKISALNDFVPPSIKGKRRKVQDQTKSRHPSPTPAQATVAEPTSQVSLPTNKDSPSAWHKKIKSRLSPVPTEDLEVVEVQIKSQVDHPTSLRHWTVPLLNRYELLTMESEAGVPDYDLKVFLSPTTLGISPTVSKPNSKLLLKKLARPFHVDNISKEALNSLVNEFCAQTLEDMQYGDDFLQAIQAQPSFFRPALTNSRMEDYWVSKATSHALCRLLNNSKPDAFKVDGKNLPIAQVLDDYCSLFEDAMGDTLSPAAALDRLCSQETPDFTGQQHIQLALWDLFAMISAPSIYFDPVKVAHATQTLNLVSLDCTKLLLWSDDTLSDWVTSDLGNVMLSSATMRPFSAAFEALASTSVCSSP
ncbi:hypothetical protein DYB25_008628 [Aphanomyces astaci]|uniref:Uncharacterized protein n=1 Tax=Aphanomyces astaci TaxID=112090 RepID=A0A397BCD5_APHAT|nr:hypothetical protein DYB36_009638 [Aphanomyces astaci]RHY37440.1 hypothetical protein DYB25_008628 [Aphanomyces astaci]RHY42248.1 hypothetical protein DYB38_009385 [Aphanomyces astaci]RHZ38261.1 hypothetical protein DYB26_006671 [Aphanomyces astaci]